MIESGAQNMSRGERIFLRVFVMLLTSILTAIFVLAACGDLGLIYIPGPQINNGARAGTTTDIILILLGIGLFVGAIYFLRWIESLPRRGTGSQS